MKKSIKRKVSAPKLLTAADFKGDKAYWKYLVDQARRLKMGTGNALPQPQRKDYFRLRETFSPGKNPLSSKRTEELPDLKERQEEFLRKVEATGHSQDIKLKRPRVYDPEEQGDFQKWLDWRSQNPTDVLSRAPADVLKALERMKKWLKRKPPEDPQSKKS